MRNHVGYFGCMLIQECYYFWGWDEEVGLFIFSSFKVEDSPVLGQKVAGRRFPKYGHKGEAPQAFLYIENTLLGDF